MKKCRCVIKGRVQGVWFRKFTQNVARKLDISGHVRNLVDGSVEVKANVPQNMWEEFIKALRKGPPLADVKEIEIEPIEEEFEGSFKVVK